MTLRIVNVVASGTLGRELDVHTVAEDIDAPVVNFPETPYSHPVVYLRSREGGPMATIFRSGSYHITGGDSVEETEELKQWLVTRLHRLGIEVNATFNIRNVVVVGDLATDVDLNQLVIHLGLTQTEYEPEQFPGVIYRPSDFSCVFLIFASGRVVVTGAESSDIAFNGFDQLKTELSPILDS